MRCRWVSLASIPEKNVLPNFKKYLFKLQSVFFQFDKCICPDWKIWIYKSCYADEFLWHPSQRLARLHSRLVVTSRQMKHLFIWKYIVGPRYPLHRNTTGEIRPKMRKHKKTDLQNPAWMKQNRIKALARKFESLKRQLVNYFIKSSSELFPRQIVGILDKSCILVALVMSW